MSKFNLDLNILRVSLKKIRLTMVLLKYYFSELDPKFHFVKRFYYFLSVAMINVQLPV